MAVCACMSLLAMLPAYMHRAVEVRIPSYKMLNDFSILCEPLTNGFPCISWQSFLHFTLEAHLGVRDAHKVSAIQGVHQRL